MMFGRLFFDFFLEKIKKQTPKKYIFLFDGSSMALLQKPLSAIPSNQFSDRLARI
jgi:hypothetical protein